MRKSFKLLIIFIFIFLAFSGTENFLLAQDIGTGYAGNLDLPTSGTTDIRELMVNIVRFALTFMALIAVIIIMYAGWLWMTAGGNPDRVNKAKKTLIGAVVGLIIILSSFAIVQMIYNTITEGLGPQCDPPCAGTEKCCSGNTCCANTDICCDGGCCPAGQYCCSGACSTVPCSSLPSTFYITSMLPGDGITVPMNAIIRYTFNTRVDNTTVDGTTFTVDNGGAVAGTRTVNNNVITFTPPAGTCPAGNPCGATNCFTAGDTITVTAIPGAGGIMSVGNVELQCTVGNPCTITFTIGNVVDCSDPNVDIQSSMQMCIDQTNNLGFTASDDNGVAIVSFSDNNGTNAFSPSPPTITCAAPPCGALPAVWNVAPGAVTWEPTAALGYSAGTNYTITATAEDIVSHTNTDTYSITLRPAHCCSGAQDGDETGIDCGGSCAACQGAACGISLFGSCGGTNDPNCNDDNCATGFCNCGPYTTLGDTCQDKGYDASVGNDCCVCEVQPIIDWVSPEGGFCDGNPDAFCSTDSDCATILPGTCNSSSNTPSPNGAEGNIVTIGGRNFGTAVGTVTFCGAACGDADDRVAPLANNAGTGNPNCGVDADMWQNNQIIVIVPNGAQSGIIRVTEGLNSFFDETNDALGANIPGFVVNTIVRPGLCDITPDHGQQDVAIAYQGLMLSGSAPYFGSLSNNRAGVNPSTFTNTTGTADVPDLRSGRTTTFNENITSGIPSNFLIFTKDPEGSLIPEITYFDPESGPAGQYVTIFGSGFGRARGLSHVYFDQDGNLATTGDQAEASYNFPPACSNSFDVWSDTQVIVKVPDDMPDDVRDYYIIMELQHWGAPIDSRSVLAPNSQTFLYDSSLPLLPGLCRISPTMAPNNANIDLWGENWGTAIDSVEFHYQTSDGGPFTIGVDDGAQTTSATIPNGAVTGPVRVEVGGNYSNGLQLRVGYCFAEADPDAACGANFCCPQYTYREGQCVANINDPINGCYLPNPTSVYEWDFSTAPSTPYAGPGEPCSSSTPGFCDDPYPECDPALNITCTENTTGPCTCEYPNDDFDSCAGKARSLNRCEVDFCPNSAGECSPYPGGEARDIGDCGDAVCVSRFGAGHAYSAVIDRCYENANPDCTLPTPTQDVMGNFVNQYCDSYNGNPRLHINTRLSCPNGWIMLADERCVNNAVGCDLCNTGYKCVDDNDGDASGLCAIDEGICPYGSSCNGTVCISLSSTDCECCCRLANANQDCCAPLECMGDCGSDRESGQDIDEYGYCSNCWVDTDNSGAPNAADQAESNDLCNCLGSTGKFCDMDVDVDGDGDPDGVCRDCGQLGNDTTECAAQAGCCINAMNSNYCTGGNDIDTNGFCDFYSCDTVAPYNCLPPSDTGDYQDDPNCNNACGPGPDTHAGDRCILPPPINCEIGLANCGDYYTCISDLSPTEGVGDGCRCCCNPDDDPDPCTDIDTAGYPDLTCQPDKIPCDGGNRGLCCGCVNDLNCGNPNNIGCGADACCRSRPTVTAIEPADQPSGSAGEVCRNAAVTVEFDQLMNTSSFSGNALLVGDYGTETCPDGTAYLAKTGEVEKKYSKLAKFYYNSLEILAKFLKPWVPDKYLQAFTVPLSGRNYCAVLGEVSGLNNAAQHGVLTYMPSQILDADRLYYFIVKGDPILDDDIVEGVYSRWNIGLNGNIGLFPSPSGAQNIFNGINYVNAFVWSFTTLSDQSANNGVCLIDDVQLYPESYLFKTTTDDLNEVDGDPVDSTYDTVYDSDKQFFVRALSDDGQTLAPVAGFYDWEWTWGIGDVNIVDISAEPGLPAAGDRQLIEAQQGVVNDNTLVTATLSLLAGSFTGATGNGEADSSEVYVFLCDNPWPPISAAGTWEPWYDEATNCSIVGGGCFDTNFKVYYCRDAGLFGTYDDLPSLSGNNANAIIRGQDGDMLKEVYFFHEAMPTATTSLAVADTQNGGELSAVWGQVPDGAVTSYNLYIGTSPGRFDYTANIARSNAINSDDSGYVTGCTTAGTALECTLGGLTNNTTYYFNLSALYTTIGAQDDTVEGDLVGDDVAATPTDGTVLPAPTGLTATPRSGEVDLIWNPVAGAVSYVVYYGVSSGVYGSSQDIGSSDTAVIVSNLTNGTQYYFAVSAIGSNGNESNTSTEATATPNTLAVGYFTSGDVVLTWDAGSSIGDYSVYYEVVP